MTYLLLAVAISFEVAATLALRATARPESPLWTWVVVVVGYVCSFAALQQALQRGLPVAVAYALWAAVGVTAVTVLAWLVFHETLQPVQVGGIVLVVLGVVLLELGGR